MNLVRFLSRGVWAESASFKRAEVRSTVLIYPSVKKRQTERQTSKERERERERKIHTERDRHADLREQRAGRSDAGQDRTG